MGIVFQTYCVFILLLALLYTAMVLAFIAGLWKLTRKSIVPGIKPDVFVSIVIAARNESQTIVSCLESLVHQNYPPHLFEVIVVNDNSEDDTFSKILQFSQQKTALSIKIVNLSDYSLTSKKEAVKVGVSVAIGTLILTTDADCTMESSWVKSMANFYANSKQKMLCGPVAFHKRKGLFQAFQALDFLSMIASGAGAAGVGHPFMGNAANMAFEKKVYEELQIENYDRGYASGDDVFLLHKVKNKYKNGIGFNMAKDAWVTTIPPATPSGMLRQRYRWASKGKGYKDVFARMVALNVFTLNSAIVCTFITALFMHAFLLPAISLLIIKILIDLPLIMQMASLSHRRYLMWHYLWVQCVYPLYIMLTGALVLTGLKYTWKGRRYR